MPQTVTELDKMSTESADFQITHYVRDLFLRKGCTKAEARVRIDKFFTAYDISRNHHINQLKLETEQVKKDNVQLRQLQDYDIGWKNQMEQLFLDCIMLVRKDLRTEDQLVRASQVSRQGSRKSRLESRCGSRNGSRLKVPPNKSILQGRVGSVEMVQISLKDNFKMSLAGQKLRRQLMGDKSLLKLVYETMFGPATVSVPPTPAHQSLMPQIYCGESPKVSINGSKHFSFFHSNN